jgi:hypothetical protein
MKSSDLKFSLYSSSSSRGYSYGHDPQAEKIYIYASGGIAASTSAKHKFPLLTACTFSETVT